MFSKYFLVIVIVIIIVIIIIVVVVVIVFVIVVVIVIVLVIVLVLVLVLVLFYFCLYKGAMPSMPTLEEVSQFMKTLPKPSEPRNSIQSNVAQEKSKTTQMIIN